MGLRRERLGDEAEGMNGSGESESVGYSPVEKDEGWGWRQAKGKELPLKKMRSRQRFADCGGGRRQAELT